MAKEIYKKSEKLPQNEETLKMMRRKKAELEKRISGLEAAIGDPNRRKWKSRLSWSNQKEGLKCHTMCASAKKDDPKRRIPTDDWKGKDAALWKSLASEGMAYICAGRNSLVRSLVVADVDDPSWTKESLVALLKSKGLEPSYVREHVPNGHKQVGFFVNEIQIKEARWTETPKGRSLGMERSEPAHSIYTAAYKALNCLILPGDPGYTGYNCQNPFLENGEWRTEWLDESPKDFGALADGLFKACGLSEGSLSERAAEAGKAASKFKAFPAPKGAPSPEPSFLDEMEAEKASLEERLRAVERRLRPLSPYEKSFDRLYFVTCTQVANRWRKMGKLEDKYLPRMAAEALANMDYLGPTGYTEREAESRVAADLRQILRDSRSEAPSVDWDKAGWTPLQRALSLKSRKDSKVSKIEAALKAVSEISEGKWRGLSLRRLASKISPKCGLSASSLKDFLGTLKKALEFTGLDRKDWKKVMSSFDFRNSRKFFDMGSFKERLLNFKFSEILSNFKGEGYQRLKKIFQKEFLVLGYNNKKDSDKGLAKAMDRIWRGFGRPGKADSAAKITKSVPIRRSA